MQERISRPVLLAAGGTGGHLFPAEALAAVLARRGVGVQLATDTRAYPPSGRTLPHTTKPSIVQTSNPRSLQSWHMGAL